MVFVWKDQSAQPLFLVPDHDNTVDAAIVSG